MRWTGCWSERRTSRVLSGGRMSNTPGSPMIWVLVDGHPRQRRLRAAVERRLREELATLQVEVNEEKTRRGGLPQRGRLRFLGFDLRRNCRRRERGVAPPTPRGGKRNAPVGAPQESFRG